MHLRSLVSSPFFCVKLLYEYGFGPSGACSLGTQDGPWFPSTYTFLMIYIVMHLHLSDKTRHISKKYTCCYRCRRRGRGWRGVGWARPGSGPRPGSSWWLRWGSPGPGPPPPHRTWGGSKKLELQGPPFYNVRTVTKYDGCRDPSRHFFLLTATTSNKNFENESNWKLEIQMLWSQGEES